jgi:hypothetical protein
MVAGFVFLIYFLLKIDKANLEMELMGLSGITKSKAEKFSK